jgi:hypothetical protein
LFDAHIVGHDRSGGGDADKGGERGCDERTADHECVSFSGQDRGLNGFFLGDAVRTDAEGGVQMKFRKDYAGRRYGGPETHSLHF